MEGIITSYDEDFNGVLIDSKGTSIAIPGTLIGERIRYHVEHISPHAPKGWGRCDALLTPSLSRQTPTCPIAWPTAGACAGCPMMFMADPLQHELKCNHLLDVLHKAGISYIRNIPFSPAPASTRYRNRTDLVVTERRGKIALGSYKMRSHDVVITHSCPILRAPINQVIAHILEAGAKLHIPAFKSCSQPNGALRYVSIFANDQGHVLIDLVCRSASGSAPDWLKSFASELIQFVSVKGVSFSLNDSPHNAIRVAPSQVLCGLAKLPEHHASTVSLFSASGFTQLNSDVAAAIYTTARDWLPCHPAILWDLYCGAGAFGRTVQPTKALYGAEFSTSAIESAREISASDPWQTHFEVIDLEKSWPNWPAPDVILLDPPRKGISQTVIRNIIQQNVPTLVYMSCNPDSFARNVAELNDHYVLERIKAFDMMPHTSHLEVLGLLRHR